MKNSDQVVSFISTFFVRLFILCHFFVGTEVFGDSIWISAQEINRLPMAGKAWEKLYNEAQKNTVSPNLSNQNDQSNVLVFAKALVYVRTGEERYRDDVINACMTAIGTEDGGRTLALGRELIAYVIAADLVGLPSDKNATFRSWLRSTLTKKLSGRTLRSTHEDRPNNWGTHAGASRMAIAVYLNDDAELQQAAMVFKGYLGDRNSYSDFIYGNDLSWQSDAQNPVGVNPKAATKQGWNIDGALPDDMRRWEEFQPGDSFDYFIQQGLTEMPNENYAYEALQGVSTLR